MSNQNFDWLDNTITGLLNDFESGVSEKEETKDQLFELIFDKLVDKIQTLTHDLEDVRSMLVVPKIADENHTFVKLILEALQIDGASHKQYFLEKIFRFICEDSYVDEAKEEFQWDDGTPA